jgi:hypothetical protein
MLLISIPSLSVEGGGKATHTFFDFAGRNGSVTIDEACASGRVQNRTGQDHLSQLLISGALNRQVFDLPDLLRATAWRTSAVNADSSTSSPAWMSIARRAFPSRLEFEKTRRILQRCALGEGQLYHALIGFASADDAVV